MSGEGKKTKFNRNGTVNKANKGNNEAAKRRIEAKGKAQKGKPNTAAGGQKDGASGEKSKKEHSDMPEHIQIKFTHFKKGGKLNREVEYDLMHPIGDPRIKNKDFIAVTPTQALALRTISFMTDPDAKVRNQAIRSRVQQTLIDEGHLTDKNYYAKMEEHMLARYGVGQEPTAKRKATVLRELEELDSNKPFSFQAVERPNENPDQPTSAAVKPKHGNRPDTVQWILDHASYVEHQGRIAVWRANPENNGKGDSDPSFPKNRLASRNISLEQAMDYCAGEPHVLALLRKEILLRKYEKILEEEERAKIPPVPPRNRYRNMGGGTVEQIPIQLSDGVESFEELMRLLTDIVRYEVLAGKPLNEHEDYLDYEDGNLTGEGGGGSTSTSPAAGVSGEQTQGTTPESSPEKGGPSNAGGGEGSRTTKDERG